MKLDWTKDNVVSREWVKVMIRAPRVHVGYDGHRHFWHRDNLRPTCDPIIEYLEGQDEAWMFHPQDYLQIVQFAVETDTTAIMVSMLSDAPVTMERIKLRPEQIRLQKKLMVPVAGIEPATSSLQNWRSTN